MFKPSLLAASIAVATSFSFVVQADTLLPTQVVTASRLPEDISRSLASVQIIDRAMLDQHPARDLGDVLRFETGIDITRLGGFGGQASIFTRGTESNHTLVLIDGVRINPGTSSQANIQNLLLGDIERIEVVKGPLSSLYGSEAIGGVINIITRTPTENRTHIALTGGTDKLVDGAVSQSIKQGKFTALVSGEALYTDGYPIVDGSKLNRGYKNQGGNLKLGYDLDGLTLGVSARDNRGTTEYLNFGTPASQDFENQLLSLSIGADLGASVNSQLRLSEMTDHIDQNESKSIARNKQRQIDWQNTLLLGDNTIIAGATQTDSQSAYDNGFGTTYDRDQDNWAMYVQDQSRFGQLSAQIGLRHEDYDTFGTQDTGNVGLGFQVNAANLVYVNAGTAFHAPDFNELFGYGGNPDLKPESSRSAEIGSKHTLGAVKIETALFETRIEDMINTIFIPTTLNINIDKARMHGVELSLSWASEGWFARSHASYVKTEDEGTGDELLRRPRRSISVAAGYKQDRWGVSAEVLAKSRALDAKVFGGTEYRRLAGYAVANVEGHVQVLPSTRVRLSVQNVNDHDYGYAYSGSKARYLGTPFTASLGAEVTF